MYLPFVGKPVASACPPTDPNCNRSWITTFVMQNFGTVNTTVSARFTSFDGTATATLTRTIAPGRSQFIDPTAEPQLLAGRYYSVVLTSQQPIGVGLGVIASGARRVTDAMFVAAARVLSDFAPVLHDPEGPLYPPLEQVRDVSFKVALEVAREAERTGLAEVDLDKLEQTVRRKMWEPHYVTLRRSAS